MSTNLRTRLSVPEIVIDSDRPYERVDPLGVHRALADAIALPKPCRNAWYPVIESALSADAELRSVSADPDTDSRDIAWAEANPFNKTIDEIRQRLGECASNPCVDTGACPNLGEAPHDRLVEIRSALSPEEL